MDLNGTTVKQRERNWTKKEVELFYGRTKSTPYILSCPPLTGLETIVSSLSSLLLTWDHGLLVLRVCWLEKEYHQRFNPGVF